MKIDLYCMSDFLGLIVEHGTGVIYGNQTGGTRCTHPTVEGTYVPLHVRPHTDDLLYDFWYEPGTYDPARVQQFLNKWGLDDLFEPRDAYHGGWGEAWVPVRVRETFGETASFDETGAFEQLHGKRAILTYQNSD